MRGGKGQQAGRRRRHATHGIIEELLLHQPTGEPYSDGGSNSIIRLSRCIRVQSIIKCTNTSPAGDDVEKGEGGWMGGRAKGGLCPVVNITRRPL